MVLSAGQSPREMYSRSTPSANGVCEVVRNQMVPSHVEWRGETVNRATMPIGYYPSTASFSVRSYCKNARRDRCQEYHNCFLFGGLEETTRTSSNYIGWRLSSNSESSTLDTDVCVWRYAPLVVLATQEEEEHIYKVWWCLSLLGYVLPL